jgi:hypothetical protein
MLENFFSEFIFNPLLSFMVIFQFAGQGFPPLSHRLSTKNLMFKVNEIPTEQKKYTFQWFRKPPLKFTVPLGMHLVYAFGARSFPPIIKLAELQ